MDYKSTLNLLKTDFPMKANLASREPALQQRWEEMGLYQKTQEKDAPRGTFLLHDGPPYSNGDVHIGTVVQNKVPKDFIVRYRTMRGFRSPYVPGWDNHGLPIENNVSKEFLQKKQTPTKAEFRKRCREYAAHWVGVQREQFRRFGITGDWENPYLTMSPQFEATIVQVFGELAEKGSIYRGLKPIHWCPTDRTALADHEIEYEDHVSPSIYVRFPLRDDPGGVFEGLENPYTVIWTTTPWTIPANLAVAVHPDADYVVLKWGDAHYLVADALKNPVARLLVEDADAQAVDAPEGWPEGDAEALASAGRNALVVRRLKGAELEGLKFTHPLAGTHDFYDRESPVVLADYVTMETGTGVVHTAPGHGREDFMTGQRYNLPILNPVNDAGVFTAEAGPFEGLDLKAGNKAVIEGLSEAGTLLHRENYAHSYPHCWRCHNPVIFRATTQWFLSIDDNRLRERALEEIHNVNWFPPEGETRITAMVGGRPDWCLSRQRSWGVNLPVFYCEGCEEAVVTPETIASVKAHVEASNADVWVGKSAAELLPDGFTCPHCGAGEFRKEDDVLDVWFDSGSTCRAVLENRPELRYPADLYLEGNDQHRGWFNSSLIVGVGTKDEAPYRNVVTHGMTVDEEGKKLSKSKGNFIHPLKMADQYGADVLRLASASYDYFSDMRLGEEALKVVGDSYRRLRNTFRFLLGNLSDFQPSDHAVPFYEMDEMDRWILHRLNEIVESAIDYFDRYEFHPVTTQLLNFFSVDLSAFYLDVLKDRLYIEGADSPTRRSAQTALWTLAHTLTRLLAPVLVHTTEEIWGYLRESDPGLAESVHLAAFPEPAPEWRDEELARRWAVLAETRDEVNKSLEAAKNEKRIGQPREAQVDLRADGALYPLLDRYRDALSAIFIVSAVDLSEAGEGEPLAVSVSPARCSIRGGCRLG
ncbi:MAG: isoleucine--tRNA ligase, partial [Armatimonadetes bacterium]|nr:isoleucine--tRNA ligase [Armatimonadota bacterium]